MLIFNAPKIRYVDVEWRPFQLLFFHVVAEYTNEKLSYCVAINY
jgi:hypothetical protein